MDDVFTIQGVLKLVGASQFNKDLQKVESQTDSTTDKMSQAFQRLGGIIASALSARAIINFTKELVSATAQVNASNAMFSAIFVEVGEAAQTMFQRVANATGVMATRLRVAGTKAFSQFKGAGLDANRALTETERYLNLAADAAAYYDMTLEDADMRLRSFIRGNVEAGDMIGLFTSETQRNTKALEMYGQKYITLTEAQKQMVMLDIASYIYDMAGATGQAARESGEYANQTGNLADSWLQLKAVLGEPILNALLPIMQELSSKMSELVDWINSNHDAMSLLIDIFETAIKTVGAYVAVAGGLKILQTVTTWVKNLTTAQNLLNTAMSKNKFGLIASVLTLVIGLFSNTTDVTEDLTDATANLESISRKYQDAVNALSGDVGELSEEERKLYEQRLSLYRLEASEQVLALADAYSELTKNIENSRVKAEGAEGALDAMFFLKENPLGIDGILDEVEYARDQMARFDFGSAEYEYYKQYINAIESNFRRTEEELYPIIEGFYKNYVEAEKDVTSQIHEMESSILSIAEAVNKGLVNVDFLKLGNNNLYNSIMDVVSELETDVSESGKKAGEKYGDNLVKAVNNAVRNIGVPSVEYSDSDLILQSMERQIQAAEQMATVVGDSFDLSGEKADIYKNALQDLFESGFKRGSAAVENIIADLAELNITMEEINSIAENPIEEIMKGLSEDIANVNTKSSIWGESFETNAEKARIYKRAIEELIEVGVKEGSPLLTDLLNKINALGEEGFEIKDTYQDVIDKFLSLATTVTSTMLDLVNSIHDLQNQALENEIAILESEYEKLKKLNEQKIEDEEKRLDGENEALKEQLYDGEISYKEYITALKNNEKSLDNLKDQLADEEIAKENELQQKKDELGKKQFESEKANKIAQVWIDAASATMRAFSENFWPVALGLTAAIATTAGIQTAAINEQQYVPALAEGGIVDKATHALIGEDGAEAIVPLERNTEWVGGLAKALAPAVSNSERNDDSLRGEINQFRQMVSDFFNYIRQGNQQIVIDGQVVARVISPYVNNELGNASRLRGRGI